MKLSGEHHHADLPSPWPSPRGRGGKRRRRGAGLVIALTTLLIVMLMTGAIVRSLVLNLRHSRQAAIELQTQWFLNAATARAAAQLRADPTYAGETWRAEIMPDQHGAAGVAEIRVARLENDPRERRVTIAARYPDQPWRRITLNRTYRMPLSEQQPPAGIRPEENAP